MQHRPTNEDTTLISELDESAIAKNRSIGGIIEDPSEYFVEGALIETEETKENPKQRKTTTNSRPK